MKYLIKKYRATQLSTRIVMLSAIIILVTAVSWFYQSNILLNAGITLVAGIAVEALLQYSRKTIILLLWAAYLFAVGAFVYTVFVIYLTIGTYEDAILNGGLVGIFGILSGVLAHTLLAKLPTGPRWINLIICFAGFFASVAAMIMVSPTTPIWVFSFVAVVLVALEPIIVATIHKWFAKKDNKNKEHIYPRNKNITMLTNKLEETFPEYTVVPDGTGNGVKVLYNNGVILFIASLAGETHKSITVENNQIMVDNKDYTWVLEHIMNEARKFSKENRINQTRITPILLTNNSNLKKSITPIKVRKVSNPDTILGTVLVVKADKLTKVSRMVADKSKPFTSKEQKQLDFIAQQF